MSCLKILIMSDTHGDKINFKKVIKNENPDITIHAGDFCIANDIMEEYFTYFVAGNNDYEGPRLLDFKIENFKVRLMHGDTPFGYYGCDFFGRKQDPNARGEMLYEYALENELDILITGHTHVELVYYKNKILIINPGSLTWPRSKSGKKSYAILYIENNQIKSTKFEDIIKYFKGY